MCGHCTAGIFLHEFLYAKTNFEDRLFHDSGNVDCVSAAHYLLESSVENLDMIPSCLLSDEIILSCSLFRSGEYLIQGDSRYAEALGAKQVDLSIPFFFGEIDLEDIPSKVGNLLPTKKLQAIYDPAIYLDQVKWSNTIGDLSDWAPFSLKILEYYYHWWIKGKGLIKNNLYQQMEDTGVFDPIDDISEDEKIRFNALLPLISFCTDVIGHTEPESTILKKIALNYPYGVPGFLAFDLWIMRKALRYCYPSLTPQDLEVFNTGQGEIYLDYAAQQQGYRF